MIGETNFIAPTGQENKLYKARVVCDTCGEYMGEKDGFEQEGATTNGRCEKCTAKFRARLEEFKKRNPLPEKE